MSTEGVSKITMVDNDPPKKAAPKKINNKVGPGSAPALNDKSTPTKTAPGKAAPGGPTKSVTPAKKAICKREEVPMETGFHLLSSPNLGKRECIRMLPTS